MALGDASGNALLITALEAAVPLLIMQLRTETWEVRQKIGAEAGQVIATQADTMMYGSKRKRGAAARDLREHDRHIRPVTRQVHDGCDVCRNGHPDYSAGEVFNFTARALAVAACQPGGVTFAGVHWCAYRHPWCPNTRGKAAPVCCKCDSGCPVASGGDGECGAGCPWCQNGCQETCDHRRDQEQGPLPRDGREREP